MLNAPFEKAGIGRRIEEDLPRLLAAAPIVAVQHELNQHVEDLRRLAPTSDATTALTLYRDKLTLAIQRAHRLELFVSAEQAAMVLGKSVSMITYLCRTGAIKAKKVGGTWQIDRLELEQLRNSERSAASNSADRILTRRSRDRLTTQSGK
jgi:hypothetical protein